MLYAVVYTWYFICSVQQLSLNGPIDMIYPSVFPLQLGHTNISGLASKDRLDGLLIAGEIIQ